MSLPLEELIVLARFRASKDARKRLRRSRGASRVALSPERRDDLIAGLLEMKRAGMVSSILWNDDRLSIFKAGEYDPTPLHVNSAEKLVELFRENRVAVMPISSEVKLLERKRSRK